MTFALMIKQLREMKNVSQYKLAHDLNIAQSTVGMWESGKREPSLGLILALSNYFEVSIDSLLGKAFTSIPSDENVNQLLLNRPELQSLSTELGKLNREQILKAMDYIQLLLLQQEQDKKE